MASNVLSCATGCLYAGDGSRDARTPLVCASARAAARRGEILLEVAACGVCRTDLHVVDGELTGPKLPIVPGHEIVGRVAALGAGVAGFRTGSESACRGSRRPVACALIAVPTGRTCATRRCSPAIRATAAMPPMRWRMRGSAFRWTRLPITPRSPLLCAGLIGWRSYRMAGEGRTRRGASLHASASTALAPPPTSWRRSRPGRAGGSMPSRAPATRRVSVCPLARRRVGRRIG